MTNEEAIRMLVRLKDHINFEVPDAQEKMDALNIAIEAINKEIKHDKISKLITEAILENAYGEEN